NAFTQRGNDPAGHKNIVRCHAEPEKLGLKTMEYQDGKVVYPNTPGLTNIHSQQSTPDLA
ncbi:MAG: hypothetical protein E6750_16970, partial [Atlantibacter hermannii]